MRTKDNLTKNERMALRTLKDNTHLTILPDDKGIATVILNTKDYKLKIAYLLENSAYKKLNMDPTDSTERKTTQLLKKYSLPEDQRKQLQPTGSRAPRLYGLPKIQKEGVPLRPTVSNIGAPTYQLAKHLTGCLNQLTGNSAHHVNNSGHFNQILDKLQVLPGDLMVRFDVVSVFTKVPADDSLSLLSHHFIDDILALFKIHTSVSTISISNKQMVWHWAHHYLQLSLISSWRISKKEHLTRPTLSPPAGTDTLMTHSSYGHMEKQV